MAEVLGVALGGGGVPGVAGHLGLLTGWEDAGIAPAVVVGTSAGGIVAAQMAVGMPLNRVTKTWADLANNHLELLDWPLRSFSPIDFVGSASCPGVMDLWSLFRGMRGSVAMKSVESWRLGFGVVTTDLDERASVLIHSGNPMGFMSNDAMQATSAYPGLFVGVRDGNGHLLADGGILNMVPVDFCRQLGATKVVGVEIGAGRFDRVPDRLTDVGLLELVVYRLVEAAEASDNRIKPDLMLRLPTKGGLMDMRDFEYDFEVGVRAGKASAQSVKALSAVAS